MDFDKLVDPLVMSTVFLLSSLIMLKRKQYENTLTRFMIAAWFFHVWVLPFVQSPLSFSVNTQRVVSRWLVLLLGLVDIVSYAMRCNFPRWFPKVFIRRDGAC